MEPSIESRLVAIEEKLSEIEVVVKKIRKIQKTQTQIRVAYWAVIVLIGLGAFYFVQPYFDQLKSTYGAIGGNSDQLNGLLKMYGVE